MEQPKRNPRILWTIVVLLCLFFMISYGARLTAKANLEATITRQTARITEAKQRQQALQQQLTYVRSDAYVEEVARNQLGMVQKGDEVLIVVRGVSHPTAQTQTSDTATAINPPFWQEWLADWGF